MHLTFSLAFHRNHTQDNDAQRFTQGAASNQSFHPRKKLTVDGFMYRTNVFASENA
jgi:hypothetical protein